MAAVDTRGKLRVPAHPVPRAGSPMTASTLILPASGGQDLASWAVVAFVASHSSSGTRQAYATQLRLWFDWCEQHHLEPLADIRRPHVELYARDLEAKGLAAATVALKLVVLTGFYRDLRRGTAARPLPSGACTPTEGLPGVHPAQPRPQRARRVPRPGMTIRGQRPRPGLPARSQRPARVGSLRSRSVRPGVGQRLSRGPHRREGQPTCPHPARATDCSRHRRCGR